MKKRYRFSLILLVTCSLTLPLAFSSHSQMGELMKKAEQNAEALRFCWKFLHGWLQFADAETGLMPRNLMTDFYWNAQDCAADNYPFLTLSAFFTDRSIFQTKMLQILQTEQRLCNRLDRLPDDWDFTKRGFRKENYRVSELIFGASEYIKDGLLPLTEWIGPSEWSERMIGLMDDIWKHAEISTEVGLLPDTSHEVGGELMQSLSRLYWMTNRNEYKEWAFRLADYFLLHHHPVRAEYFQLDDHGCEVLGGLSEVYLLASYVDAEKHQQWREPMHELIRRVLEVGRNSAGLFYEAIDPKEGKVRRDILTDNWGYNYNAVATVGMIDKEQSYLEEVQRVLDNLIRFKDYPWENDIADGLADSLEGAINLICRFPSADAEYWCDYTARRLLDKQRPTGILEGWYADGNSARTMLMYALWKSQGCYVDPWRADVGVGATRKAPHHLMILVKTDWTWQGKLLFDVPRHKKYFNLPVDYPRINQFPEWFTLDEEANYRIVISGQEPRTINGKELRDGLFITVPTDSYVMIDVERL